MSRFSACFAAYFALIAGCATATDEGIAPSATHDSGVHGVDARVSDDTGSVDDTFVATFDSGASIDDSGSTSIDTGVAGDDAGPTDPSCAATSTNTDCQTCCYTAHTDAYNAFAGALSACACKPTNCATECAASACASPPSSADSTCLPCIKTAETGACKSDVDAVCGSPSGACYPFARCVITSGCNSKP